MIHPHRVLRLLKTTQGSTFTRKQLAVRRLLNSTPQARKIIVSHDPCPACHKAELLMLYTLEYAFGQFAAGAYCGRCGWGNACGDYEHKHEVTRDSDNSSYQE